MAVASSIDLKTQAAATSQLAGSSQAGDAGLGLAKDFNTFLTLLTTQLKYQDPTAPMDTNQFTQQLVAFTGVEQQVNTNKNLEKLVSGQQSTQFGGALGYIGKEVEAEGKDVALVGGKAKMSFDIAGAPNTAQISISDSTGTVLATQTITAKNGSNTVYWDGTKLSGSKAADGAYTYTVTAKDSTGQDLTIKTYTAGTITGVSSDSSGNAMLEIGDVKVATSKVVAVHDASVAAPSTNTASNTANTSGASSASTSSSGTSTSNTSGAGSTTTGKTS